MAIANNRPGADAKVLKRFGEPAWNYQVVRYLNAESKDIIPREDKIWTVAKTAKRMVRVLEASGKKVPQNLAALASHN